MKILFCTYMVGAAFTFTFMFAPIICVIISIAVVLYMVGLWHHYYKLIKQGKLTEEKTYKQGFLSKVERKDKAGFFEIQLYNNRVYFYAKFFGHALPFRQYRINRKTTLYELFEEVENWKY